MWQYRIRQNGSSLSRSACTLFCSGTPRIFYSSIFLSKQILTPFLTSRKIAPNIVYPTKYVYPQIFLYQTFFNPSEILVPTFFCPPLHVGSQTYVTQKYLDHPKHMEERKRERERKGNNNVNSGHYVRRRITHALCSDQFP